jgi:hypothetical protein
MLSKTTAPLNSAQKAAMMNSPKKISSSGPEVGRGGMWCRERCNYRHSFRLPLPRRSVLRWLKRREPALGHDLALRSAAGEWRPLTRAPRTRGSGRA